MFKGSFFPSSVSLWNALEESLREIESQTIFKAAINNQFLPVPPPSYYGHGDRFASVQHTRLRLKHDGLNRHLHQIGVLESSECACGFAQESELHYIFQCQNYQVQREQFANSLQACLGPAWNFAILLNNPQTLLKLTLCGSEELTEAQNKNIFEAMHVYIKSTKRFNLSTH